MPAGPIRSNLGTDEVKSQQQGMTWGIKVMSKRARYTKLSSLPLVSKSVVLQVFPETHTVDAQQVKGFVVLCLLL